MQKFQNMEHSNSRTFQVLSRTSQGPYEPWSETVQHKMTGINYRPVADSSVTGLAGRHYEWRYSISL